jgi:HPt (histidine-containing phosphotransfer) domain-containing protein
MALLNQQFYTIYEMDKEFTFKLAKILESSTIELLSGLEISIDNADVNKSKNLLHTIKGSAANFGAEDLSEKARQIESAIYLLSNENKQDYQNFIKEMKKTFELTLQEVETKK